MKRIQILYQKQEIFLAEQKHNVTVLNQGV
jgi:hypothetical protein